MAEHKESTSRTLLVALVMCIVCSVVVATAAVLLKPKQQAAQENDRNINILRVAGLYQQGVPVAEQMGPITPRVIDFESGRFTDAFTPAQVVNAKKVAKDPETSFKVDSEADPAKLIRREKYGVVYLVEQEGEMTQVLLPIRGYGLWSTLWGFLSIKSDFETVGGLGYYQHAETPGLGGEVDNPVWKEQWRGKKIYQDGELALRVIKGKVDPESPEAQYQVDGLSGATITTNGVDKMVHYWLSDQGYGKFLKNLKAGEA